MSGERQPDDNRAPRRAIRKLAAELFSGLLGAYRHMAPEYKESTLDSTLVPPNPAPLLESALDEHDVALLRTVKDLTPADIIWLMHDKSADDKG